MRESLQPSKCILYFLYSNSRCFLFYMKCIFWAFSITLWFLTTECVKQDIYLENRRVELRCWSCSDSRSRRKEISCSLRQSETTWQRTKVFGHRKGMSCYRLGFTKISAFQYGRSFVIETYHKPLVHLQNAKVANSRLMRWSLYLQSYNFPTEVIKGSDNLGADFLSRHIAE